MPHYVHTQVREIALKGSLRSQMHIFHYLLPAKGFRAYAKLVRGVLVVPIIVLSPCEGLAR